MTPSPPTEGERHDGCQHASRYAAARYNTRTATAPRPQTSDRPLVIRDLDSPHEFPTHHLVPRRRLQGSRPMNKGFGHSGAAGKLGGLLPTLSAGSVVQLASAAAALATIPVLVHELGAAGFGVLIVVVSLAPWLTLVDGALYPTTRLLVGEARDEGRYLAPPHLLRAAFRMSVKIAAANLVTLITALVVLPLVALFGSRGVAGRGELVMAVLLFALPLVLSGPGGIYLGALEGVGRTVVAALFAGTGPLVALPLTLAVAGLDGGLVPLCAAQGIAAATPRFIAWAYWRHKPSLHEGEAGPRSGGGLRLTLVLQMAVLTAAVLIQTGLDPIIVASQLGAAEAGAYGLAWRLVTGAMIPITVVTPLFMANIAGARAQGWSHQSDAQLRRLVALAAVAGLAVAGAVTALGPSLASWLGGGEVNSPRVLYLAGACLILVTFAATPLYLAFSGPRALAWSVRLNLWLTIGNVSTSLALVQAVGVSGPLWASVAAGVVGFVALIHAWQRHPEWLSEVHGGSSAPPPTRLPPVTDTPT